MTPYQWLGAAMLAGLFFGWSAWGVHENGWRLVVVTWLGIIAVLLFMTLAVGLLVGKLP